MNLAGEKGGFRKDLYSWQGEQCLCIVFIQSYEKQLWIKRLF